jgi:hypothetical protein
MGGFMLALVAENDIVYLLSVSIEMKSGAGCDLLPNV